MLKLYHTYKKKLVSFKPIKKGEVGIYNCGPTVYDNVHIGNLRTFVFYDFVRRAFEYLGYSVTQVMNITDVGHLTMTENQKKSAEADGKKIEITDTDDGLDRMEKAAKKEGVSTWDVAKKYTEIILGKNREENETFDETGDFGKLNILRPQYIPKATDHIQEQIEVIRELEKKGYTYVTKQAVYFDISKFKDYEKLVGQKLSEMKKGKRAADTDPGRKNPADFRLWQLNQPDHEMQWDSPWGRGYPGWHIECSAMSKKYLGQPFDLHTGGEDHIKVHHVDEIAQSESAYDKTLANYWIHGMFLTVDGRRMGKSLGNAYTLKDLQEKGYDPLDLRYFYLQSHYRTKQDFTWKCMENARSARKAFLRKIRQKMIEAKMHKSINNEWKEKFIEALEDDLNSCKALTVAWDLLSSEEKASDIVGTMLDFDEVLGLNIEKLEQKSMKPDKEKEIEELINERSEARKSKNWERADEIRKMLLNEYDVELEDKEDKTTWKPVE